jgi:glutamine synthetase
VTDIQVERHYLANGTKPHAREAIAWAGETQAAMVDLKFCDLLGTWQHVSLPVTAFEEEAFEEGLGFDGSSIRGWQSIEDSDMLLMPDPESAILDPATEAPTLSLICEIADPLTRSPYAKDPRGVARRAEEYLRASGIADTAYFGPEAEFFIFDDVRFHQDQHSASYSVDSVEGAWNTAKDEGPNLGFKIRYKEGYFPLPPMDHFQDIRSEMVLTMERLGIEVEIHHHEVGTAGQAEIDMRYDTLLRMADKVMLYKYVVKNVARANGYTATFMPKPLYQDNGSGMHTHQSLFQGDTNAFYDADDQYHLSDVAKSFIAGQLKHARELSALFAPSVNSYKRLVPGYEAPVYIAWSRRNRSALVRVPMYHPGKEKATRMELRCPDPSCNPYLTFAGLLQAGLEGIEKGYELPEPMERNLYDLSPTERHELGVGQLPETLGEAIEELSKSELVEKALGEHIFPRYIDLKRQEWEDYRVQVTSWELDRYLAVT